MLARLSDFASYQSYLSSVVRFSSWCSTNFLHLNVSKTKEMCIDFCRNRTVISPIVIYGEPVEQVDSFKYLGVVLDMKLPFTEYVTAVQKKSSRQTPPLFFNFRLYYPFFRNRTILNLTLLQYCYYPASEVPALKTVLRFGYTVFQFYPLEETCCIKCKTAPPPFFFFFFFFLT
ncbi:hypothetical protein NP493_146g01035 [Ridgeia piscesae]|uniref:Uncharacterized protein n=1 Tax=Ridgeia piscesae TaxID=27915 RepID=A0AAD9UG46_RIDPI|nr:hypothetical protein NP493_146g01035 [Ridgeia piscesae]